MSKDTSYPGPYVARSSHDAGQRPVEPSLQGRPKRILALLTDAHGSMGGISQYNRDLLEAFALSDRVGSVDVIPRLASAYGGTLSPKIRYHFQGLGGIAKYCAYALRHGLLGKRPDVVVCGHLNLLPVAWLVARCRRVPLWLLIYGIEVWQPSARSIANRLTKSVDHVVSISEVTLARFERWSLSSHRKSTILPNAIHLASYAVGEKADDLLEQYGLRGKRVVMTFGRMVGQERAKGFDEVLELMPRLRAIDPTIVYLAAGRGPDLERLRAKAKALGVEKSVVFTGLVPEERKADYFRLADAYVMPSHGEGFGFVLLEALACGIPVVASTIDGGFEAIRKGELGIAVNPTDQDGLMAAILKSLERPKSVPAGLEYFSFANFAKRVDELVVGLES